MLDTQGRNAQPKRKCTSTLLPGSIVPRQRVKLVSIVSGNGNADAVIDLLKESGSLLVAKDAYAKSQLLFLHRTPHHYARQDSCRYLARRNRHLCQC